MISANQLLYENSRKVRRHFGLLSGRSIREYKENQKLGLKDSPEELFNTQSMSKSYNVPAFSSNRDTEEYKDSQDLKID